jgi:hypothetical protein
LPYEPGPSTAQNQVIGNNFLAQIAGGALWTPTYTVTVTPTGTLTPVSTPTPLPTATPAGVSNKGNYFTEYFSSPLTQVTNLTIQITPPPFVPSNESVAVVSSQPVSSQVFTFYNYSNLSANINSGGGLSVSVVNGTNSGSSGFGWFLSGSSGNGGRYPNYRVVLSPATPLPTVSVTPVATIEVDFSNGN